MDIRIDGNRPVQNVGLEGGLPQGDVKVNANQKRPALTVTRADEPEKVKEVADEELTRDDALGKLISSAYNLPAPDMPKFE